MRWPDALEALGEPHLGAAALICFEWLQRPENVLAGSITWDDYRGSQHPKHVRIFHHKTGSRGLSAARGGWAAALSGDRGLSGCLDPAGISPMVVTNGTRGAAAPLLCLLCAQTCARSAQARGVRRARHAGRLPARGNDGTGDAELAEQGVMALSGHKTPHAARLYVKRTERQRVRAAAKRRAWVEAAKRKQKWK